MIRADDRLTVARMRELAAELGGLDALSSYPAERQVLRAVCRRERRTVIELPIPSQLARLSDAYDAARTAAQELAAFPVG